MHNFLKVVCLSCFLSASLAQAATISSVDFERCLKTLESKARQAGISDKTIDNHLGSTQYVDRVIELDRQQPEFTTSFANYFNRRVTEQRVQQGRTLLDQNRPLLNDIAREFGVPAQYLVAFWGLETNYGAYFGRMPILDSLATLACDQRRSDFFTTELINALHILDEGAITADRMRGSWAGAMGHVQFMPSVFMKYALDYDDSGRRDLWNSLPDAMASAANYLRGIGWETGYRWGREVKLPKDFDYRLAGLATQKTLKKWQQLGISRIDGSPLGNLEIKASLLVPASHQGPTFLVYDNFHVIMRWNRSEAYALSVGHLADRIAGAGRLSRQPPEAPQLHRDQVIQLQQTLADKGFDTGNIDGILGPATREAISRFQATQGKVADGFPDQQTLSLLGLTLDKP